MPGYLVDEDATVMCSHVGEAKPTVTSTKVKADGKAIVTLSSVYTVSGCTMPPPPAGMGPCVTAQWLMGATKVMSMGEPVLLESNASATLCTPTATPLQLVVTQMKVKGK